MSQDSVLPSWLARLDAPGWLAAAETELAHAGANAGRRRTALTHARRAGGMALNAVLMARATEPVDHASVWGRSYLDHLRQIADQAPLLGLPDAARDAARVLVETPIMPPQGNQLVKLRGPSDDPVRRATAAAQQLSAMARSLVEAP